ncbi:MAG TPA: hypothetical protein PKE26_11675 [Kiritimatiellia bacterium]|nr:hypothetical protein [Kiritimatiellia bacterium]HMO99759.1 hypothetical protein [Kiritimatiellia bacterium]
MSTKRTLSLMASARRDGKLHPIEIKATSKHFAPRFLCLLLSSR